MIVVVTWETGLFAVLCMLIGLILCFFGIRLLQATAFFVGVYLGYILMYSILGSSGVTNNYALIFGSLGFGILVGLFMILLLKCLVALVLFLIGFVAGWYLGIWILSWVEIQHGSIDASTWRWIVLVACGVVIGIVTACLPKLFLAIATSWVGSYLVFYGIDVFAQTGYADAFQLILTGHAKSFTWTNAIYGMLIGNIVLAVIGILVQLFITGRGFDITPTKVKHSSKA